MTAAGIQVSDASDEQLLADAGTGNVTAFDALYSRYARRAYQIALSICDDGERAQEAVQDAFLSVWQTAARFSADRGTFAGWLMTIVRHRAIDIARSNTRHASRRAPEAGVTMTTPSDQTCDALLRREADRQLRTCLARLPAAQQEIITLAYFAQLSHTEIAHMLNLPNGTVKGRIRLGMEKLRVTVERP